MPSVTGFSVACPLRARDPRSIRAPFAVSLLSKEYTRIDGCKGWMKRLIARLARHGVDLKRILPSSPRTSIRSYGWRPAAGSQPCFRQRAEYPQGLSARAPDVSRAAASSTVFPVRGFRLRDRRRDFPRREAHPELAQVRLCSPNVMICRSRPRGSGSRSRPMGLARFGSAPSGDVGRDLNARRGERLAEVHRLSSGARSPSFPPASSGERRMGRRDYDAMRRLRAFPPAARSPPSTRCRSR